MRRMLLILSVLAFAGCVTPSDDVVFPDDYLGRTQSVGRAVVVGLTAVDPTAYGGWPGDCPGCDVDSEIFAMLCKSQGLSVTLLQNAKATRQGVLDAGRKAWSGLKEGDLFVIFISGHGGQVRDTNGDEEDGQDETLCLWDGQLSDDVLKTYWEEIPAGVRVFFVSDTCNSGSNFKYKPRALKDYPGQLIHFGGCADGKSSYGDEQGGTLTTALIDAWQDGITYKAWFDKAAKRMPRNQIPVYVEYGNVNSAFRDRAALK